MLSEKLTSAEWWFDAITFALIAVVVTVIVKWIGRWALTQLRGRWGARSVYIARRGLSLSRHPEEIYWWMLGAMTLQIGGWAQIGFGVWTASLIGDWVVASIPTGYFISLVILCGGGWDLGVSLQRREVGRAAQRYARRHRESRLEKRKRDTT